MARSGQFGFGTKLLVFIVLLLSVYNAWQVAALNREVAALKLQISQLKAHETSSTHGEWLPMTQASESLRWARKALASAGKGDVRGTASAYRKSMALSKQAGESAVAPSVKAANELKNRLDTTSETIAKALDLVRDKKK